MATVTAAMWATPGQVFAVLADGWAHAGWVVGASHVRAVEAAWPAIGSRLHHASRNWPFLIEDETRVEAVDPGWRLVLFASGGPLGQARVDISLIPVGPGGAHTRVTMVEDPVTGPGKWFHNPLTDAVLHWRNAETQARLTCLVEYPTK